MKKLKQDRAVEKSCPIDNIRLLNPTIVLAETLAPGDWIWFDGKMLIVMYGDNTKYGESHNEKCVIGLFTAYFRYIPNYYKVTKFDILTVE